MDPGVGQAAATATPPRAPQRLLRGSITLGTVAGTRIRLHFTLLLFLALLAAILYRQGGAAAAASGSLFYALLFLCVLLHEFGHIIAARGLGVRTPEVVLLPIGGISRLERIPERPRDELLVALAGPATSLALALALALALGGLPPMIEAFDASGPRALLAQLAYANLMLLVFNMIPAFPMDGGRVLRALLSWRLGHLRGTRIAAAIGQGAAILIGLLGLFAGHVILVLIALFVYFSANSEAGLARLGAEVFGLPARALMISELERLPASATAGEAAEALIRTSQTEFPVVDAQDRLLGVLTRDGLIAGFATGGAGKPVVELMDTNFPTVSPWRRIDDVAALFKQCAPAVAVLAPDGCFQGFITRDNLLELMMIGEARSRHARQTSRLASMVEMAPSGRTKKART